MHYVPESACEFFQEKRTTSSDGDAALAQVAPLYALTVLVGLLLAADFALGTGQFAGWDWFRAPWGYRLALFAAVLGGSRILYHSLENVLAGRFGADLALTTACLAAIALGEYQTAGLVVFIALVGESVEGFTLQQAMRAIRSTFEQRPATAQLLRDGLEREVAVADLQPDDEVVVRPGERIPADGRIVAGASALNESPYTGESLPVDKGVNDPVLAGSVNLTAALTVHVERTGAQTALAEMERLVRQAATRKMHCERTADRFARWFLPAVMSIAAITLFAWRFRSGTWQAGWMPALGVLVVACPCPLILATPCAVMAALTWLARRGIVVKGSAALERLATVDTIAFDKTGTLSEGDLSLGDVTPLADISADDLLQLAASAERPSSHPIARLLRTAAEERSLPVAWPEEFAAQVGAGVTACVKENRILIGSERLIGEQGVSIPDAAHAAVSDVEIGGQTPLLIAVDGQLKGILGVRETLRESSATTLRELRSAGIRRIVLLTGDRTLPALAAARTLNVFDQVAAEQSPEIKARWIETARGAGHRVAMVGDGVNDGPALAAADVGIAICQSGSELAGEAGDILLLGEPLRPLPGLVRLSRSVVENIRQNLWAFAVGVNGLGILATSFGWLTPVWAALFHEAASLLVMLNALRLLWFQDRPASVTSSSPNWRETFKRWSKSLAPGRILAGLIRRWRTTLQVGGAAAIVIWLCSQIVLVRPDEAIAVLRGGKYHTTLTPGWSWRWPWPMERLIRVRPAAVQSVPIGFRRGDSSSRSDGSSEADLEWTSVHEDASFSSVPEESLFLTGDEVALELTADVQYRVGDVQRYALSGGLDPESAIRSAAESILRAAIAAHPLDDVLTEQRAEIEQRCRNELLRRIDGYDMGVEIVAMHWLDVHPPRPVVDAYRQVSDASEQREQAVNEAQALATRTLFGTAGEPAIRELELQTVADGTGSAPADWSLTEEAWKSLSAPDADGQRKLSGAAGAILLDAEASAEQQRQQALGQAERLRSLLAVARRQPELSRQQLYWTAVLEALRDKPFTLIDPALSGRRHVYLGDVPTNVAPLISAPAEPEK